MKNVFNAWENISSLSIDKVANFILTGHTANRFYADDFLYPHLTPTKILDFGCGIGRNTFGLSVYNAEWKIVGYDSDEMLKYIDEYKTIKYTDDNFPNVDFSSDWNALSKMSFDSIFCAIVLQHIMESDLKSYINDFKKMTNTLLVAGRRFNDDTKKRSTWKIIEECGLIPLEFYKGHEKISYSPDGDGNEHNLAIYKW